MASLRDFKCPNCGGSIEFNSSVQKMKCPFCDSEFEMDALADYDQVLESEQPDSMSWNDQAGSEWSEGETSGMRVYSCRSCGGEIVADQTTAATECPFCGNQVVMTGNFSGDLKPDYIIPFKLDKRAAKEAFLNHLKNKPMLPKIFKDENHIDEIKGVYVPFWLFDTDAEADIRYRATTERSWESGGYEYTETNHFAVTRGGTLSFDKVPVDGSKQLDNTMMESLEPFNFKDAVGFQTAYTAGYMAHRYDVTAEESIGRANDRIKRSTEDAFARTVTGYNTVVPEHSSIRLQNGITKYALYPVWLLNTTWQDKQYLFAMNGQTGKFVGDLPVDNKTSLKWFGLITVGVTAGLFALCNILHFAGIF